MVHKVRSENGDLCVKVEKISSEHAVKVEKVRSDVVEPCDRFEKVSIEHAVEGEKVRSDVAELCDKVEKMSSEHSVKVEKVSWSEVAELWDRVEKMSSEHAVEVEKVWSAVAELRDWVEKVSSEHAEIHVGVEKVISENAEMRAMEKNKTGKEFGGHLSSMEAANSGEDCPVKVAVHVRPLIGDEKLQGCQDCVTVVPGKPQVFELESHSFTFDHVLWEALVLSRIALCMKSVVALLLMPCLKDNNATFSPIGQTVPGTTYIHWVLVSKTGCQTEYIPLVMNALFNKIGTLKHQTEFHLPCVLSLRVTERSVRGSERNGLLCLEQGSLSREQPVLYEQSVENEQKDLDQIGLFRFKEGSVILSFSAITLDDLVQLQSGWDDFDIFVTGVDINKGLLALGNVSVPIGDEKSGKNGVHVPY
nr:kinesin-like protein KIN-4A isoform X1 [Ipomoea batatas]